MPNSIDSHINTVTNLFKKTNGLPNKPINELSDDEKRACKTRIEQMSADEFREAAAKDSRFKAHIAGGPGGQGNQHSNMAVRGTHLPTKLTFNMKEERSQLSNKNKFFKRLQQKIIEDCTVNDERKPGLTQKARRKVQGNKNKEILHKYKEEKSSQKRT